MKAVSLFAGVGGFDLALTQNGAEVVCSVEIDGQRSSSSSSKLVSQTIDGGSK